MRQRQVSGSVGTAVKLDQEPSAALGALGRTDEAKMREPCQVLLKTAEPVCQPVFLL